MTVEPISTYEELAALRADWAALVDRCPTATVFQRPEWLLPWWKQFGSGEMFVIAMRDDGRLVGLMPAFLHDWEGRRQCTLIGTGPTDYLDLIAESDCAASCAAAVHDVLRDRRWDLCDWQDLPPTSPLLRDEAVPCETCTELALPVTVEEFDAGLPHGMRRNVRRYGERLRAHHKVRFDTSHVADGKLLDRLFELHAARWQTKGQPGMLAGRETFLREATGELSRAGLLRVHALTCDDQIAGLVYQLAYRDRAYGYITGFDPALEPYSPGTLLLDYALRSAMADGARYWDFLRGRERYKLQWGATEKANYRLRLRAEGGSGG